MERDIAPEAFQGRRGDELPDLTLDRNGERLKIRGSIDTSSIFLLHTAKKIHQLGNLSVICTINREDVTRNKVTARLGKLFTNGAIVKETVKVDGNKRMAYRVADGAEEE